MSHIIYDEIRRERNGKELKITIQQVTPDLIEPVIEHLIDHFLQREPLLSHIKVLSEPTTVESLKRMWRFTMGQGASIVALIKEPGLEPKIVGANATCITRKSDPPLPEFPGEKYQISLAAMIQITEEADLWNKYNTDSFLSAFGLSVHREYHGLGLGAAILKAREKVCKKFGVTMTESVFTAPSSQHIASSLGYETVLEIPYKDFDFKLSDVYRDLEGKMCVMVKKYD